MAELFGRRVRLVVGEVDVVPEDAGLRVAFSVVRSTKREANQAKIQVYNLSAFSRSLVEGVTQRLILEAGYPSTIAAVFCGDRSWVSHKREGTDWVTTIESGDGIGVLKTRVKGSFGPGANGLQVLQEIQRQVATSSSLDAAARSALQAVVYLSGRAFDGTAGETLKGLADDAGLEFSVQDCSLQFSSFATAASAEGVLVSAATGLLAGVERFRDPNQPGLHVVRGRSLLQPGIVPGRRIQLESEAQRGVFQVRACTHTGDTHGSGESWITEWEAVAL